jgi:hypothetical protein
MVTIETVDLSGKNIVFFICRVLGGNSSAVEELRMKK